MTQFEIYKANAAAERLAAANALLVNRRVMHERSAEMWEGMAANVAATAERSIVNEAAKAAAR